MQVFQTFYIPRQHDIALLNVAHLYPGERTPVALAQQVGSVNAKVVITVDDLCCNEGTTQRARHDAVKRNVGQFVAQILCLLNAVKTQMTGQVALKNAGGILQRLAVSGHVKGNHSNRRV